MTITIQEHKSASYAPRTYFNASQGFTLAIAIDFTTAGERLTHKASTNGILQIDYSEDYIVAARKFYKALKQYAKHNDSIILNIAGNGIYTWNKYNVTQQDLNIYLYSILSLVHQHLPIDGVVSGGQTGTDIASLVVASVLGIDAVGTWPKGYKMRFEDGVDVCKDKEWLEGYVSGYVSQLLKAVR